MKNIEEKIDELTKKMCKKIYKIWDKVGEKENYEEFIFKVKETLYSYCDKTVSLIEKVIREDLMRIVEASNDK